MQNRRARLVSCTALTHDTMMYVFSDVSGEAFSFQAGQYMILQVNDGREGKCTRSYSLASDPKETPDFDFLIRLLPDGRGSQYLQKLQPGDEVEFMGPFGHFVLNNKETDLVFIATGTGLAPFLSMLPVLFSQSPERKVTLYFGVRYEADVIYEDQLKSWAKEHPNFKYILTVSRPGESWQGSKGRVTEYLEKEKWDPSQTDVYICGNGDMVKTVKEFYESQGFARESIHLELFTPIVAPKAS